MFAPWEVDPPDPPSSDKLCRVYARCTSWDGVPRRYYGITFRGPYVRYPAIAGGWILEGETYAISDREGLLLVDLPRGASMLCDAPNFKEPVAFTVPDAPVAELTGVIFPYPRRLFWAKLEGDCLEEVREGDVFLPGEKVRFALRVEWSDGTSRTLSSPYFDGDDWESLYASKDYVVGTFPDVGSVTLRSVEEPVNPKPGDMWRRAGYDFDTSFVYFLPGDAHTLRDTPNLTFWVAPGP